MCTVYDDDSKCLHWDEFGDWCEECVKDWLDIIGEDD